METKTCVTACTFLILQVTLTLSHNRVPPWVTLQSTPLPGPTFLHLPGGKSAPYPACYTIRNNAVNNVPYQVDLGNGNTAQFPCTDILRLGIPCNILLEDYTVSSDLFSEVLKCQPNDLILELSNGVLLSYDLFCSQIKCNHPRLAVPDLPILPDIDFDSLIHGDVTPTNKLTPNSLQNSIPPAQVVPTNIGNPRNYEAASPYPPQSQQPCQQPQYQLQPSAEPCPPPCPPPLPQPYLPSFSPCPPALPCPSSPCLPEHYPLWYPCSPQPCVPEPCQTTFPCENTPCQPEPHSPPCVPQSCAPTIPCPPSYLPEHFPWTPEPCAPPTPPTCQPKPCLPEPCPLTKPSPCTQQTHFPEPCQPFYPCPTTPCLPEPCPVSTTLPCDVQLCSPVLCQYVQSCPTLYEPEHLSLWDIFVHPPVSCVPIPALTPCQGTCDSSSPYHCPFSPSYSTFYTNCYHSANPYYSEALRYPSIIYV